MNKRALKYAIPLAAIAAGGFDDPADAGPLFLKIGDIEGESTAENHEGEIDVLAWSWGVAKEVIDGKSSKTSLSEIKIIKSFDAASTELILAAAKGTQFGEAKLTATRPSKEGSNFEYLTITLDNVLVTKIAAGGKDSENGVAETISLNFAKIELEYKLDDGKGGTTTGKTCWDVQTNTEC